MTRTKIVETGWVGARVTSRVDDAGPLCQAGHCTSLGLGVARTGDARERRQVSYCVEDESGERRVRCLQSNDRSSAPKGKLFSNKVGIDTGKTKLQLHRKGGARFPFRIATWNVHTFNVADQVESVSREASRLRLNCLGVSETHWTGSGKVVLDDGKCILYSGKPEGGKMLSGVGMWLDSKSSKSLLGF